MSPRPTKRYTCNRCGEVYVERWHGTGSCDFTVDGPHGEGVPACGSHPTHAGRGPHDFGERDDEGFSGEV